MSWVSACPHDSNTLRVVVTNDEGELPPDTIWRGIKLNRVHMNTESPVDSALVWMGERDLKPTEVLFIHVILGGTSVRYFHDDEIGEYMPDEGEGK